MRLPEIDPLCANLLHKKQPRHRLAVHLGAHGGRYRAFVMFALRL